jgi:hypothetical protein
MISDGLAPIEKATCFRACSMALLDLIPNEYRLEALPYSE